MNKYDWLDLAIGKKEINRVNDKQEFEILCRLGHKAHSLNSEDKSINGYVCST